jgi:curved DNA-binding protein CbpA
VEAAEIRALAGLLDELDYYQLLEARREASTSELKQSYYDLSRRFHPDANRAQPPDVRGSVERIAKRLTEAWSVLRDPRRRRAYDQRLGESGELRIQLAEAEAAADKQSVEARLGTTSNGRRYCTMALADIERGDLKAAARNFQMALTFEPANPFFKQKLEELRSQLEEIRKQLR